MRTCFAAVLATVLVTACGSSSSTAPEDALLVLETVVKTSYSGFTEAVQTTVATADEWSETWRRIHAGLDPAPALPAIDFERQVVVLAAAGTRPNGCYELTITSARRGSGGAPLFEITETRPGPTCVCTEALTQPVHAVRVARFAGPASFIARSVERAC